ncbi:M48 family metalloprotease [Kribbella sp. NPDC056345]|uniref:M48 family metalloprotease n=1 Tax=Kribbella sp. NPDC056345 TaxID=3345789 RepID=UPI0035DF238C
MNGANSNNFPNHQHTQQPPAGPPYQSGPPMPGPPPYPVQQPQGAGPYWPAVPQQQYVPQQLPSRPASIVRPAIEKAARAVRQLKPSAWVELGISLPWLWWSWLAVTWAGRPGPKVFWSLMIAWVGTATAVAVWPRLEQLLATRIYRLRKPSNQELQQLGLAWFGVCTAARVNPHAYTLWVHEGPEATAPNAVAGSSIAVTSWAIHNLPRPHLEAVLAHELAHHLVLGRVPSLLLYWLTLPARLAGHVAVFCWRTRFLNVAAKVLLAVMLIGIVGVGVFLGWDSWWPWALLSPFLAPVVVPFLTRIQETMTDRVALELGYGVLLAQVFAGREHDRNARSGAALKPGMKGTQPLESARLQALEEQLNAAPRHGHQPPY